MEDYFIWYKTIHIISVISWMVALLYLPRIFVYHTRADMGSEMDKTFQIMEKKLLKIIMTPAIIFTYIFGSIVAYIYGLEALGIWFHIKILCVFGMTIMYFFCIKWVKDFANGNNKHSEKFYRIINEVPAVLMVIAVIMVVVKPFE